MSLSGKTIVVTRDANQAKPFVNMLKEQQANVILFPTIKLENPDNIETIKEVVNIISDYNWIIFTSAIAVRFFMNHINPNDFANLKIACVGIKTAKELKYYNLSADLIPREYTTKDLLSAMEKIDLKNKQVLIPCSSLSNNDLKIGLENQGTIVNKLVVYKNSVFENPDIEKLKKNIEKKMIDCISFFSPSAVNSFVRLVGEETVEKIGLQEIPIAVIGLTTGETLINHQLKPTIKPTISDNESMVIALVEYFLNQ